MSQVVVFRDFPLDRNVVARIIYKDRPHWVTPAGVQILPHTVTELQRFVNDYTAFLRTSTVGFFRIDAHVTYDSIAILEVNAAFVDGWGTALNLARAAGIKRPNLTHMFPEHFTLDDLAYLPELHLLITELNGEHLICRDSDCDRHTHYVYGRRNNAQGNTFVLPHRGVEFDDKRHLARFADTWQSKTVHIPTFYTYEGGVAWQDVPDDVYLKFAVKDGPNAQRARFSVLRGKPSGKARFLRSCYEHGELIAQARVDGAGLGGQPYKAVSEDSSSGNPRLQLVILAHGTALVGYVQYAYGNIITDDSLHGPLAFG